MEASQLPCHVTAFMQNYQTPSADPRLGYANRLEALRAALNLQEKRRLGLGSLRARPPSTPR
jgi:hypothetical protein